MRELTGKIHGWWKDQVREEQFIIWGVIVGDINKRWRDGTYFHTSGIKNRKVKEGDVVDTRNSRYELGQSLADVMKERNDAKANS